MIRHEYLRRVRILLPQGFEVARRVLRQEIKYFVDVWGHVRTRYRQLLYEATRFPSARHPQEDGGNQSLVVRAYFSVGMAATATAPSA